MTIPTDYPQIRLAWPNYFVWLAACLCASIPAAWLSVRIEQYRAPLLLFPLMAGAFWAAVSVALVRLCRVGNRRGAVAGAILTAMVFVCAQHYFHYRARLETWTPAQRALAEVAGDGVDFPDGPLDHLLQESRRGRPLPFGIVARGTWAWLSWAVDAAIVIGAAGLVVSLGTRGRYCQQCRSWVRTIRGGELDPKSAAELARLCHMEEPPEGAAVRYRMLACAAGCGPYGFELSWKRLPRGRLPLKAGHAHAWFDAALRNQVASMLDETV